MARNTNEYNEARDLNHVEEDIELLQEEDIEVDYSDDTPDLTQRKRSFGEDMMGFGVYDD